jgi:hypothetical protein
MREDAAIDLHIPDALPGMRAYSLKLRRAVDRQVNRFLAGGAVFFLLARGEDGRIVNVVRVAPA